MAMHERGRSWLLLGCGLLATIAVMTLSSRPKQLRKEVPATAYAPAPVGNAALDVPAVPAAAEPASEATSDFDTGRYNRPVPYADSNGVVFSYGDRVRFATVADCSETFVQSSQGDWIPTQDCGPTRLVVDHPYGSYTIAQLEQAANEMSDGDAAYILAERFASEKWRNRRDDAHTYYLKAFLLTSDSEIYRRMLSEMGLHGGVRTKNGELDVANLSANYTMFRVGQMFGVVDDAAVDSLAAAARGSDAIDLAALDRQAQGVYESLLEARGQMR